MVGVLEFLLANPLLLLAVGLLALVIGLSVLNGLIEMAIYLAFFGAVALFIMWGLANMPPLGELWQMIVEFVKGLLAGGSGSGA